ncbi:MAG: AMP-binding protein [Deltaproteobacteria bacterium]|nr:AMP-binding protein [Deltaproteobacteria bacterium]MBW2420661.1 AMP-binding protein [Deltaproteobacteria bacterium]
MSVSVDSESTDRFQFAGQDIPWLLDHWAAAKPDHPLLVWVPRGAEPQRWSYREFNEQVGRVAAGLHARGVGKGDKVLIHADNCPEMVFAWYACAKLGAVGVTTNTRSVGAEIQYFAEHTGCVGAVTQPKFAAMITEHAPKLGWIVVTDDNGGEAPPEEQLGHGQDSFDTLLGDPATLPERSPEPMLPAGIVFTSGTTSRPKAVVHTHANALWSGRIGSRNIDMTGDDTYLIYLPFFHVNAQSWSFWAALGVGATLVLQPRFSASRFWEVILEHEITHISLIPFVFKAIAAQPVPEHKLKAGVFGLVMPDLEAWLKLRVVPAFGMTETVTQCICADAWQAYPNLSMGKPTPGYECLIVDPDSGALCEEGEIGELWVRGTRGIQLFLEYYDNKEAMEKSFTPEGWFKTGDMVRLGEAGNLFYCDRDKDALKVGGENVSAREIEDMCRQAGGIGDIAVVAKSHDMLDMVPVAFVIRGLGAPESEDEHAASIIEQCKTNLADFKVPRAVYFVEEFPTATLEKVAKNRLREMADEMPAVD